MWLGVYILFLLVVDKLYRQLKGSGSLSIFIHIMSLINNRYLSVKFMIDIENKEQLSCLKVRKIINNSKLFFNIFNTFTQIYS